MGVLTINPYGDGSKEPLPIFSREEEAEILLRFEAPGVKAGGSGRGVRWGRLNLCSYEPLHA